MQCGNKRRQRGATFLGTVTIVAILGLGVYAGIRLVPKYLEYMAVARALDQTADSLKDGDLSPASIRNSLERRWAIEDINSLTAKDVDIDKVANGVKVEAKYRAEAPFIGNVSLVVDFDKSVTIRGSGGDDGIN